MATQKRILIIGLLLVGGAIVGQWRYRVTRPDYRLARGQQAVQEFDWQTAEHLANRLEATGHPDHAHLLRGELLYVRKQPDRALAELNQIKDQGAIRLRAAAITGRCLLDLGAQAEAERVFMFVIDQDPNNTDAHRGLASIAYDLGQMNRAIAHLEQVARLDPNDARPHRLLAEILRDSEDIKNAILEYQEALRIGNGLSDVARDEIWFSLAESLIRLTRFPESLEVLDEAAKRGEEPLAMQALRAEALRALGRRSEAIAIIDRGLQLEPDGAFCRQRGQLYLDDGDPASAIPLLERAVRNNQQHYQSHFLLAQAYAAAGREADAERSNARADEIRRDNDTMAALSREAMARPWDAAIRLRLAEVCERTGDPSSAAMWRNAAAQCQARNWPPVSAPK
jgi:tetratricopeptide (TPR) repeat protein